MSLMFLLVRNITSIVNIVSYITNYLRTQLRHSYIALLCLLRTQSYVYYQSFVPNYLCLLWRNTQTNLPVSQVRSSSLVPKQKTLRFYSKHSQKVPKCAASFGSKGTKGRMHRTYLVHPSKGRMHRPSVSKGFLTYLNQRSVRKPKVGLGRNIGSDVITQLCYVYYRSYVSNYVSSKHSQKFSISTIRSCIAKLCLLWRNYQSFDSYRVRNITKLCNYLNRKSMLCNQT